MLHWEHVIFRGLFFIGLSAPIIFVSSVAIANIYDYIKQRYAKKNQKVERLPRNYKMTKLWIEKHLRGFGCRPNYLLSNEKISSDYSQGSLWHREKDYVSSIYAENETPSQNCPKMSINKALTGASKQRNFHDSVPFSEFRRSNDLTSEHQAESYGSSHFVVANFQEIPLSPKVNKSPRNVKTSQYKEGLYRYAKNNPLPIQKGNPKEYETVKIDIDKKQNTSEEIHSCELAENRKPSSYQFLENPQDLAHKTFSIRPVDGSRKVSNYKTDTSKGEDENCKKAEQIISSENIESEHLKSCQACETNSNKTPLTVFNKRILHANLKNDKGPGYATPKSGHFNADRHIPQEIHKEYGNSRFQVWNTPITKKDASTQSCNFHHTLPENEDTSPAKKQQLFIEAQGLQTNEFNENKVPKLKSNLQTKQSQYSKILPPKQRANMITEPRNLYHFENMAHLGEDKKIDITCTFWKRLKIDNQEIKKGLERFEDDKNKTTAIQVDLSPSLTNCNCCPKSQKPPFSASVPVVGTKKTEEKINLIDSNNDNPLLVDSNKNEHVILPPSKRGHQPKVRSRSFQTSDEMKNVEDRACKDCQTLGPRTDCVNKPDEIAFCDSRKMNSRSIFENRFQESLPPYYEHEVNFDASRQCVNGHYMAPKFDDMHGRYDGDSHFQPKHHLQNPLQAMNLHSHNQCFHPYARPRQIEDMHFESKNIPCGEHFLTVPQSRWNDGYFPNTPLAERKLHNTNDYVHMRQLNESCNLPSQDVRYSTKKLPPYPHFSKYSINPHSDKYSNNEITSNFPVCRSSLRNENNFQKVKR